MAEVVEERRSGPKSVKDVPADEFIKAFSAYLKKTGKIQLPASVDIMKTGSFKELAPYDADWYYVRAAAIARRVYIRQGLGVGAFRRIFGGRSNAKGSVAPEHFAKAAGGVVRHALQQLEALGLVEKTNTEKGGRKITPEGQRQMDLVAASVKLTPFALLLE
ncbi:RPS19 [Auxenochlorella protothecoides x Auxenochlorella symbiontica]|uniref:40S ribosomal protein S19-1 n=2 Tax=Auxenochlorella protothecoides TaxID=3075 RepID=A0A087SE48_AUXPR|nr:40S ribosomal protein S19-1 [Auxenochlorella protothecoides]KFM24002.1 40S ribosomal protein S19-1 [Auxenochlorella protothecoides]RMZ52641.1 hypothetical protein APUTEX25_000760 [Auxenochlorella protothecoides]|eukprot:RMZ52641.1 hypothetical protein APUTEX25_000760 [Auxenochlorella protothecoides]